MADSLVKRKDYPSQVAKAAGITGHLPFHHKNKRRPKAPLVYHPPRREGDLCLPIRQ